MVAQLVDQSLPTQEVNGLNPIIKELFFTNSKNMKIKQNAFNA